MRFLPLFVALSLALASMAPAMTPSPDCLIDEVNGRIVALDDPAGTYVVWPQGHRGGVVTWDWVDAQGRVQGAVQICQGGTSLRYSIAYDRFEAADDRVYQMLGADTVYSLGDVAAVLRDQGARVWRTQDLGTCGCRARGF